MMKFKNTDIDVQNVINRMADHDTKAIIYGISSDIAILNLNAVIFGTKFKMKDSEFVETMKNTLINSETKFFGIELNKFVLASLHLLQVQEYVGDDETVNRIIKSNFDF